MPKRKINQTKCCLYGLFTLIVIQSTFLIMIIDNLQTQIDILEENQIKTKKEVVSVINPDQSIYNLQLHN